MKPLRKRQDKIVHYLRLLFCAGTITLLVSGCKPPSDNKNQPSGKPSSKDGPTEVKQDKIFLTSVLAQKVSRGEINATVATTGKIIPLKSRLLKTEESGELHFASPWEEGDFIKKGEKVAWLESDTLKKELKNSRADLQLSEESLDISKKSMESKIKDYQAVQDLYVRGIVPQKEVDSSELSMQQTINSYRREQISLEKAKTNLQTVEEKFEHLEVFAPFDGLLVSKTTLEGSKPFSTIFGTETITDYSLRQVNTDFNLCGIIDTSQVILRCDVTSRDIDKIRLEQPAKITVYARDGIEVEGQVVDIGKSVKEDTGAFKVDLLIENPDYILRPGMFARANVITETHHDAISIPKEVISQRNGRDVIFVAQEGVDVDYHLANEIEIETGLEGREVIEVTWGLKEDDSVIIRGFEVLQDQAPINVLYPDDPVLDVEGDKLKAAEKDKATTQTLEQKSIPEEEPEKKNEKETIEE